MVACGRHEKGAPPTHANEWGSAKQKTGSTGLMTIISDKDQRAKAILDVIISLGGKKSNGSWWKLPHLCGGKLPGDRIGGGGLKVNIRTGGVKCHYGCDNTTARAAVFGHNWRIPKFTPEPEPEPDPKKQKLKYSTSPLRVLDETDAGMYLKGITTRSGGQVQYRRSSDGLLAWHYRYIDRDGNKEVKNPGLKGDSWTPRIWEPKERIRSYLVVTEGEKDAATACTRGLTSACYPGGAGRAASADWLSVQIYANERDLQIVICPDTGEVGEKAAGTLATAYRWHVAHTDGVPDGDCPLDMTNWLERLDLKKPWDPRPAEKDQNTDPPVFDNGNLDFSEAYQCTNSGNLIAEHALSDRNIARFPVRCRDCQACIMRRRRKKMFQFSRGCVSPVQTVLTIPGWTKVDSVAKYRDLDAHSTRVPGAKRTTHIIPQAGKFNFTLVMVFDGEISEKQKLNAERHATRYGRTASISVGPITQWDFEKLIPDLRVLIGKKQYRTLTMTGWAVQEDNSDYVLGKATIVKPSPHDKPLTKPQIPFEAGFRMRSWKRLHAKADPGWREMNNLAADLSSREWMKNCGHLAASVVRSDVKSLDDWDGPIHLLQNTGKFIEGILSWRRAYGHVLMLAGLSQHIPESEIEYFEEMKQQETKRQETKQDTNHRPGPTWERPRPEQQQQDMKSTSESDFDAGW